MVNMGHRYRPSYETLAEEYRKACGMLAADAKLKEKIAELTYSALFTDGAHHKQWYLERIMKEVTEHGTALMQWRTKKIQELAEGEGMTVEAFLAEHGKERPWEEGIAP